MKRIISNLATFFLPFLITNKLEAQNLLKYKPDVFIYKSVGPVVDTFYFTRERINKNVFKQITYYGRSDNTSLSTYLDTFIIDKLVWQKIYNNDTIAFLSVKDFLANKKGVDYLNKEKKELAYEEYEPVKKIKVQKKIFYLYLVRSMSSGGMVESLGDDIYYIVFDFTIGEVYRSSYHIKKVLEGYEKYVPFFKW